MDEKTELLTYDGWVPLPLIKKNHKIISMNTNKLTWSSILKIDKITRDSPIRITNLHLDIFCIKDHFLFLKKRQSLKFSEPKLFKIKDLALGRYRFLVSGTLPNPNYPISDNQIKLLAWILTDGSYNGVSVRLFQSKRNGISQIKKLLENLKIDYREKIRIRNVTHICGKKLKKKPLPAHEFFLNKINTQFVSDFIDKNKNPKKNIFLLFSQAQIKLFIKTLLLGDGSVKPGANFGALDGKKEFLDWVQILCSISSIKSSLSNYRNEDWRLNINFNRNSTDLDISKKILTTENYSESFWELATPLKNCLIRRNGKSFLIGTS